MSTCKVLGVCKAFPRESKDQTLPIGRIGNPLYGKTLKTILCLVLDFQGFLQLVETTRHVSNTFEQKSDWRPFPLPEITVASGKLIVRGTILCFWYIYIIVSWQVLYLSVLPKNKTTCGTQEWRWICSSDNFLGGCNFKPFFNVHPKIIWGTCPKNLTYIFSDGVVSTTN